MTKYLYVYHGGANAPRSKEEGEKMMKAWTGWLGKLGSSVVDGGHPLGMAKTVAPNGSIATNGGPNPARGYSIIEASSIDDATAKAKGCPVLASGGSVEVAEIVMM